MEEKVISFNLAKMVKETGLNPEKIKNALRRTKLSACKTSAEVMEVYENTPSGSEAGKLAIQRIAELVPVELIEKALELCKTSAEAMEVYNNTLSESEAEKLAIQRIAELVPGELSACKTSAEAMGVYNDTPSESEARKLAIQRIARFYGWSENED